MALDGIFLHSLCLELKNTIVGCRIDKINQSEKDEIIITYNKDRKNHKLLISASANCARINYTNIQKENPMTPPTFCMVMRKYLNSSRVLSVSQCTTDRVLLIDFESTDELGFDSIYTLVIEIMGRHSNVSLVRKRDNLIMDSIKHVSADMNSYRVLYPGLQFVFPPESKKINPFSFSENDLNLYVTENNIEFNENYFSTVFTGISKPLSKEICFRLKSSLTTENFDFHSLKALFKDIENGNFEFNSYSDGSKLIDFHCIDFNSLNNFTKTSYNSPSELIENFYYEKDRSNRLNSKTTDLQKVLKNNLDRCSKKIKILQSSLEECAGKDIYRLKGELLTANIYILKKGMRDVRLINYYSNDGSYIDISINENKTPSQNIQVYYKKYNKLKKSEEMGKVQLENTYNEVIYLESVLNNIQNIESSLDMAELKKELMEEGYLKFKKGKNKKEKKSKPLHFTSKDGLDIYVGKNNIQNDYLTLKFANKNDIWLHTKNIPGSHVIISNNGDIPESTLEEAANLAAYYSKGKNSTKVAVDYTIVKNVKKPSGAKPGMVIYSTNQTIYIDPIAPNID